MPCTVRSVGVVRALEGGADGGVDLVEGRDVDAVREPVLALRPARVDEALGEALAPQREGEAHGLAVRDGDLGEDVRAVGRDDRLAWRDADIVSACAAEIEERIADRTQVRLAARVPGTR